MELQEEMEEVTQGKRETGGTTEGEETMEENEYDKYLNTEKMEKEQDVEAEINGISSEDRAIAQNVKPEDVETEETAEENYEMMVKELEEELEKNIKTGEIFGRGTRSY